MTTSETFDVPLAWSTTLRLGGPARRLVEATTADEVVTVVAECDRRGEPVLLLGGGSNVVIGDDGFDGTVVLVRTQGIDTLDDGDARILRVQAGEDWDGVVAASVAAGLAGMEALAGIPGCTGSTPIQNVGAYGQDVSQTIRTVTVYDRERGERAEIANADCGFRYRHSRFKGTDRYVVLEVQFALRTDGEGVVRYAELARHLGVELESSVPVASIREAVLAVRRGKGMVLDPADPDTWSAGSFFTNPILTPAQAALLPADAPRYPDPGGGVKTSAAWLIEHAGFGRGFGLDQPDARVSLSTKHTLALTNRGTARTADLVGLARRIRDVVRESFGVDLVPEPVFVGVRL